MAAVTGAISRANANANPMPARTAAMNPSQPAQDGRPGSKASIQGSASQSNNSFKPNHSATSANKVKPSVFKNTDRSSGANKSRMAARAASRIIRSFLPGLDIGGGSSNRKNPAGRACIEAANR